MVKHISNELFSLDSSEESIYIRIRPQFRNLQWAKYYGYIQKMLTYENSHSLITIDFSKCEWLDPIPLLSFILSVNNFQTKFKKNIVEIKVPNEDSYNKGRNKKILKFLATEGFLDYFLKISKRVYNDNYEIDTNKIFYLSHMHIQVRYSNCSVLPCTIINLGTYIGKDELFEKMLSDITDKVRVNLLGKDSQGILDEIIYKVKILLDETLQNVKVHAYNLDEKDLFAGVYIRFRYGLNNKAIASDGKNDLEMAILQEELNCPMLDKSFVESQFYFLEVFVLDQGMGIKDSLDESSSSFTFREAIIDIMLKGKRGKRSINKNLTEKGGLNLIYKLLNEDKDYLCGLTNGQWIGEYIPFETRHVYTSAATIKEVDKSEYVDIYGLSWLFRLSISTTKNLDPIIWSSFFRAENSSFLFQTAYSLVSETDPSLLAIPFRDYRFDVESSFAKQFDSIRNEYSVAPQKDTFVVLPMKGLTKSGIWNLLEKALAEIESLKNLEQRTLVIADISDKEALVYIASLANVVIYYDNTWKTKISNIVLVTRSLNVCFLRKRFSERKNYQRHPEGLFTFELKFALRDKYIETLSIEKNKIEPGNSLINLVQFLRFYDSQLLWNYIFDQSNKNTYFVNNENIEWDGEFERIDGYLNFSNTLNDPLLSEIYGLALERCAGLFENGTFKFEYLDDLAKAVIERASNIFSYLRRQNMPIIYIGSVFATNKKKYKEIDEKIKNNTGIVIYFFIHPDTKSKDGILSFLHWPSKEVIKKQFEKDTAKYKRIGRTFAIAKYGAKYFTIPRYLKTDDSYFSFYLRTPRDTYRDWQSIQPSIVAFGNHTYEGLNDLISVDLKKALEHSFKFKTELAKFLVGDFLFALLGSRVKKDVDLYIKSEYLEYKELIINLAPRDLRRVEFYEVEADLIVYPDHADTNLVVQYLKKIISDSALREKFVPLRFIKSNNVTNSLLVSPLTLDHIGDMLKKSRKKNPTVLIFDSVLVSGKTRKQIKHTLFGFGINNIKTLIILDRSRLPISLPNEKNLRAYWRFDVPTFATNGPNIVTRTIDEIFASSDILVGTVIERLNEWRDIWTEMPIYLRRHSTGLSATGIRNSDTLGLRKVKYSINNIPPHEQLGGDQNFIELTNSHGIIIFLCEVRIMTGRDDLLLRFLNEPNLSDTIKIEIICSQLLLFPKDLTRETLFNIVERLFVLVYSRGEYDNHTSLAAITLCAQEKSTIKYLLDRVENQTIHRVYKINLDIQIAIAHLSSKYQITSLEFTHYNQLLIKRKDDNLLVIYKRIHFEIFQEKGKLHSKPLLTLIGNSPYEIGDKVRQTLNSIYRLTNIFISDIRKDYLNTSIGDGIDLDKLFKDFGYCQEKCESLLKERNNDISGRPEFENLVLKVQNDVLPQLFKVHKTIFTQIDSIFPGERPLEKKIRAIIVDITQDAYRDRWISDAKEKNIVRSDGREIPKILVSVISSEFPDYYRNFEKIFIPYDYYVHAEIKDILYNSLFSSEMISNPWNNEVVEKADMWVGIVYEEKFCKLIFVNSVLDEYESIKERILSKIKYERTHLTRKLDCKFDVAEIENISGPHISVNLSIPITK